MKIGSFEVSGWVLIAGIVLLLILTILIVKGISVEIESSNDDGRLKGGDSYKIYSPEKYEKPYNLLKEDSDGNSL